MQKLNLFDPRTKFTEMLQESAYQNSFIIRHYQALPPSIEGMPIATSMNLSLTNIANEVVVNHKNFSSDEKITLLLRKCVSRKRKPKTLRKYPGDSQILMLGKSIARDD